MPGRTPPVGTAIEASVSADPAARPFKGSVVGQVAFTEVPRTVSAPSSVFFGYLRTDSSATGTATHLGKTSMTSSHCTPAGDDFGPGAMVLTSAEWRRWGRSSVVTVTGSGAGALGGELFSIAH